MLDDKATRTFFGPEAESITLFPDITNSNYHHHDDGIATLYPLLGGMVIASALSLLMIGLKGIQKKSRLDCFIA